VNGCRECVGDPVDPVASCLLEQVEGLPEVDNSAFIGVGGQGIGDGCLVVQQSRG
jgi:hypothetical protein